MNADRVKLNSNLTKEVKKALKSQGISSEPYDADFVIGTVTEWLGNNDCALTADGVRRFRRE